VHGVGEIREFLRLYQPRAGQFWIRRVNHPFGAVIAMRLLPGRVTPNAVTVAGVVVHLFGAVVVGLLAPPVPVPVVLVIAFAWQLAFALDCADGQLARARRASSAFGAWFDQLADVVSHAAVFTALTLFVARALDLDPGFAAAAASIAVSASLLQNFSTWQRLAVVGEGRPVGDRPGLGGRLLYAARHLIDYGLFLFVGSVLLLVPVALLWFLAAITALNVLYVAALVLTMWRRQRAGGPASDGGTAPG
jgi:phosphatidylglycerophosphate synthase